MTVSRLFPYRRPAFLSFGRHAAVLFATAIVLPAAIAHAGTISYTCSSNINTLGPSSLCSTFNSTIAGLYASTFSNANASVFIQFGNTGLGGSSQYLESISYAGYRSLLQSAALPVNGGDARDASAVASLPAAEPAILGTDSIILTGALAGALAGPGADFAGTTSTGASCSTPGVGNCYNGVITLATPTILASEGGSYYYRTGVDASNAYDIFTVAEHETDEILGTISCGGTSGSAIVDFCTFGSVPYAAAADLFRYNGPGSRVGYTSTPAYFSSDGGVTSVAPYNYLANNADFGDFSTNCKYVQDAFGCPGKGGLDITNDGGPEIAILDTVGYSLSPAPTSTPEPGSLALAGTGLGLIATLFRRRRFA